MTVPNDRIVRVGIVGAGAMGREHAKVFGAMADVRLVGIASRTQAKADVFARDFAIPAFEDISELSERAQPHLVVVAVPELQIARVMHECCGRPWAILMEKPPGYDLADSEAILAEAEAAGTRVMVGLNRRFLSSTSAVVTDLEGDASSRFIHVQDQQNLDDARAIGHPEMVVSNWMYANSIHLIDFFSLLGRGEVTKVEQIVPWTPKAPNVVLAKVCFASGDLGLYEGIWHGPGPWACTVTTQRRRWELRPLERAAYQNRGERKLNAIEPDSWDTAFKPGLRRQAEHAIARLRGLPSKIPDLASAVSTMRLIRQIFTA